MGKITKERPHGFKTETEAWNEDTKDLEHVEKMINENKVNKDNWFSMISKVMSVSDRISFGARRSPNENRYNERMKYCQKLKDKIREFQEK